MDSPPDRPMRDPSGHLSFHPSTVVRHLASPIGDGDFFSSALARSLVESGLLLPFEATDSRTVASPRVPFVSYPSEWCDAQLHDAALLTLQIEQRAVADGFDLKDASAWNVLYQGTRPVFCDHSSFEPLSTRKWWAMGQFARHFVAPLAVSGRRGFRAHRVFQTWRDGMPAEASRGMLGPARFASRYWPLLIGSAGASTRLVAETVLERELGAADMQPIRSFRSALLAALGWMVLGVDPAKRTAAAESRWDAYVEQRDHYGAVSVASKRACVSAWLERIQPQWVADFGCNTGEFSELAMTQGASVVALDADHDSVQKMFSRSSQCPRLFPIVADFDDLSGGRGWAGDEFPGLADRLTQRFDVVMVLALIHHLAVSLAIPLLVIAQFCARCTRRWLIVELIDESDRQLLLLCAQRRRDPREFSLQRQRDAFSEAGFELAEETSLSPLPRSLLLLKRRA